MLKIKNKPVRYVVTFILGSGRLISSAALQNLGVRETLFRIAGIDYNAARYIAYIAVSCNILTNATTRFKAINDKLSPEDDTATPKPDYSAILEKFNTMQNIILHAIVPLGILDAGYLTLNYFNSIIDFHCFHNRHTDQACLTHWHEDTNVWVLAGFASLSTLLTFFAYNVTPMIENAIELIGSNENRSAKAIIKKLNFKTGIITLVSCWSLMVGLYFSTSKMMSTTLPTDDTSYVFWGNIVLAVASSITLNLFTRILEASKLIDKQYNAEIEGWFNKPGRYLTYPTFLLYALDVCFDGLANFAGSTRFLQKVHVSKKVVIYTVSAFSGLNSAFLYSVFNTRRAITNVSNMFASLFSSSPEETETAALLDQAPSTPRSPV